MILSNGLRERNRMKKVLIVITKADWAGAQRVVYEIAKYISEEGTSIQLDVAVGSDGILIEKLNELGIRVIRLKKLVHNINLVNDYNGYKELVDLIKKNNYDVVHAHSTKAGILARMAANKCKVKNIIYTVHGWWPILQFVGIKRRIAATVERYMAHKCNSLVFICQNDIALAKKFKIGKEVQYKQIYNSITIGNVKEDIIREEFNISEDIKIIGNVARVDNQKNPILFLDIATESLKNAKSDLMYIWVGDGPLLDQVRKEIKNRGLDDKVKFIGFRKNGIDYINSFDVLLMTSEAEGMPITVLEAIELNKPIISTDVGGIKEVVGETNVYIKEDSKSDIVNMIENAEYKCNIDNSSMQANYVKLYLD